MPDWCGSPYEGFLPNEIDLQALPKPPKFTPEQCEWLRDREVEAVTADLRAQGAFEYSGFERVYGNLAPRMLPNWKALVDLIARSKQYHEKHIEAVED
jgi:hypothetical protein